MNRTRCWQATGIAGALTTSAQTKTLSNDAEDDADPDKPAVDDAASRMEIASCGLSARETCS